MSNMIGKYKVIKELGKGATATVYLATDPEANNREVAIKLVQIEQENQALSRRLKKLFQTEYAIGRRLDHPNLVHIYDAVIEKKYAYIVMEYIRGVPLDQFCTVDKLLPLYRVVGIIFKCCLALDYAYRQGVIHRDIKPANILVDEEDNPKITDFGLSLNLKKAVGAESTFIMGVGSPAYMSPEQIKAYPLNQMTDIYSLGVVLFQMLTGRLPYRATNAGALVYKIINMEPPSVTSLNPSLPITIDKITRKSLEKDLFNRYKNGAEFAKDLSTVRFQIVEDDHVEQDLSRFSELRNLQFFDDFDDVELWEVLRVSSWKEFEEDALLIEEGEVELEEDGTSKNTTFGLILSGTVEVSVSGMAIGRLGAGEVIGEMTYLNPKLTQRSATVMAIEPVSFFSISGSALSLSSEEVRERMQKALINRVLFRLNEANQALAKLGKPALKPKKSLNPNLWEIV